jgi:hypothetical protein
VSTFLHDSQDGDEPLEVVTLRGSQWMFFEERDDGVHQMGPTLHGEAQEHFVVVAVPRILDHAPTSELLDEEIECGSRARRLGHRELVLDLPAESASRVANHGDREAALAVDEADDPLLDTWPFLLIARTGRIFTSHAATLARGCDTDEYRRILGVSSK